MRAQKKPLAFSCVMPTNPGKIKQPSTGRGSTDRFLHLNLVDLDAVQLVFEVVVELELVPILHVLTLWNEMREHQHTVTSIKPTNQFDTTPLLQQQLHGWDQVKV